MKPLYGTIAYDGKVSSLYYKGEGEKTGVLYGNGIMPEMKGIPVIRFDKANYGDVIKSLQISNNVEEHYGDLPIFGERITLEEYIRKMLKCNIPIDYL